MPHSPAGRPAFLLRTLGAAELCEVDEHGHVRPRLLGPGKPLALLAYCCCSRDREHSRDFLASLLWDDTEPARSRQSLRQALWRLRRIVGDYLRTRDDAVLGVDGRVASDRDRFLDAVHAGDAATAVATYGGPFLAGLNAPGGDEFEDWAALERRHLEESLLRVAEPLAKQLAHSGRPAQVRELVERLMVLAPDSLDAHRIAVEMLLETDDRVGARRAADALESVAHSLGGRAPSSMEALVARARNTEASPSGERTTALVLDLVGRENAFSAALGAWGRARANDTQVVVLSGVPGIGKSRLLMAIAQRCRSKRTLSAMVRANPGEREVPFGFAAAIVRALAPLPGAAGVSGESARELVALDPGLGSRFATTPSLEDGGEAVRRRAFAVLDLLSAIVEQEPLALFLDDLHWADVASRQLLSIVLGRATDLSLLVVATTRGSAAAMFDQRLVTSLALLPLADDELVDAVRSSGSWPDTIASTHFMEMLTSVCDGIPLGVMERLALVRERGLLELVNGEWRSPDWAAATAAVALASPLDHQLNACTDIERAVLLSLAVAGTPLSEAVVARTVRTLTPDRRVTPTQRPRAMDASPTESALATLEVKGLVVRTAESWMPSHDVITERMLSLTSADERHACHVALAQALSETADIDGSARAVRHFLLGGDDQRAGAQLGRVIRRARAMGDRRRARDMLTELIGERLPDARINVVVRGVPLWDRVTTVKVRLIVATAVVVTALSLVTAWYFARQPALIATQSPTTSAGVPVLGPLVLRTIPSIVISTGGHSATSTVIHVHSLSPRTTIIAGDSVRSVQGVASFTALRYRRSDSVAVFRFEAPGFRSVEVSLRQWEYVQPGREPLSSTLRLVGGLAQGQQLDVNTRSIRVAPNELIQGFAQAEYSSLWAAASVWLSMTPTWGDPKREGRELFPVSTPAQHEIVDIPIAIKAPSIPGQYWLLYLLDAEPSGMFGLSRTNWTVEQPLWDDGNDFASTPDSVIRQANIAGTAFTTVAYPSTWARSSVADCTYPVNRDPSKAIKLCRRSTAMFGIEVIVK
ncbi:MAG: AAA family ATPase [Gemmatimonadaceae bacterium]|nr:AAA family ATPase [Gemmatimonadaceae bacterium]